MGHSHTLVFLSSLLCYSPLSLSLGLYIYIYILHTHTHTTTTWSHPLKHPHKQNTHKSMTYNRPTSVIVELFLLVKLDAPELFILDKGKRFVYKGIIK